MAASLRSRGTEYVIKEETLGWLREPPNKALKLPSARGAGGSARGRVRGPPAAGSLVRMEPLALDEPQRFWKFISRVFDTFNPLP